MSLKGKDIHTPAVDSFILLLGRMLAGVEFLPTSSLRPPALTDVLRSVIEDMPTRYKGMPQADQMVSEVELLVSELERRITEARPDMERLAAGAFAAAAEHLVDA